MSKMPAATRSQPPVRFSRRLQDLRAAGTRCGIGSPPALVHVRALALLQDAPGSGGVNSLRALGCDIRAM